MTKKTKFDPFTDERLFEAESDEGFPLRVAYLGLQAVADKNGRFPWMPRTLKRQICPHDDLSFTVVLAQMERLGLIEHDDEHGVIVALKKEAA